MIKSKRVFHFLKLGALFSFFTYTLSALLLMFSVSYEKLLENTFLSLYVSLFSVIINLFFISLKYLSLLFFIGILIGLFIVFYVDFLQGKQIS